MHKLKKFVWINLWNAQTEKVLILETCQTSVTEKFARINLWNAQTEKVYCGNYDKSKFQKTLERKFLLHRNCVNFPLPEFRMENFSLWENENFALATIFRATTSLMGQFEIFKQKFVHRENFRPKVLKISCGQQAVVPSVIFYYLKWWAYIWRK